MSRRMTAESAGSRDCERGLMKLEIDINLDIAIDLELHKFYCDILNQEFDWVKGN